MQPAEKSVHFRKMLTVSVSFPNCTLNPCNTLLQMSAFNSSVTTEKVSFSPLCFPPPSSDSFLPGLGAGVQWRGQDADEEACSLTSTCSALQSSTPPADDNQPVRLRSSHLSPCRLVGVYPTAQRRGHVSSIMTLCWQYSPASSVLKWLECNRWHLNGFPCWTGTTAASG